MFISFEVENYRSIKNKTELIMTAINYYKENESQLIKKDLPGLKGIDYLRVAAVYGSNASGKSSFFSAMKLMKKMVLESSSVEHDEELNYRPFLLDGRSKNAPTTLSMTFLLDSVRYEYSFSYNSRRIIKETLNAYPKGRCQQWFKRQIGAEDNQVDIEDSPYFRIPAAIKPLINDNSLLLSTLSNYPNYKSFEKADAIKRWFKERLNFSFRGPRNSDAFPYSAEVLSGDTGSDFQRNVIQTLMKKADIGIQESFIKDIPFSLEEENSNVARMMKKFFEAAAEEMYEQYKADEESVIPTKEEIFNRLIPDKKREVKFSHIAGCEKTSLDISEESDGTYQLFVLSGDISRALEDGSALFIDELDSSLHPFIVEEIVKVFLSPESNPRNAQLVFTAHNPCLLNEHLLRRDQIWLTQKMTDGSTEVVPLSEYNPRKDESRLKGYLSGRYSAVPAIPVCFGLCASDWENSNE